jgi:hypothetical protein
MNTNKARAGNVVPLIRLAVLHDDALEGALADQLSDLGAQGMTHIRQQPHAPTPITTPMPMATTESDKYRPLTTQMMLPVAAAADVAALDRISSTTPVASAPTSSTGKP